MLTEDNVPSTYPPAELNGVLIEVMSMPVQIPFFVEFVFKSDRFSDFTMCESKKGWTILILQRPGGIQWGGGQNVRECQTSSVRGG